MVSAAHWLLAAGVLGTAGSAAAAAAAPCSDLMPSSAPAAARALAPEDLVRLRDIGPVDPFAADSGLFAISPDGRRAAFQLRRADPAHNDYCLAMIVLALDGDPHPRIVDSGGELIRDSFDFRGKADFPTGIARVISPRWSSDGRWIAYLRRDRGRTQVWRAAADGSGSAPISTSASNVEDFRITPDDRTLIFQVRPGLDAARANLAQEGLRGFHYDARYAPASSSRPYPAPPIARVALAQDLVTGEVRAATQAEAALLSPVPERARELGGRQAWIIAAPDSLYPARGRLAVGNNRGHQLICPFAACADAAQPWWTTKSRVRFVRHEGWAASETAIYEWKPGPQPPRRLYRTDDVLVECAPRGDNLVCLREGSRVPRRLERLDPATGRRQLLFDPNPECATLKLGAVRRLHIRNYSGLESIADLVLPVGYQAGRRYPMVVVQYNTRGFLRGGTGDEYPIQAFANRGYAVLSVSRPKAVGLLSTSNFLEADRRNLVGFADRRSVLNSLEQGVRIAIAEGVADPERIGITGMSDGASTAGFALLHSRLFAAAAMSQCCADTSLPMRVGPAAAQDFYAMGYPKLSDDSAQARAFWAEIAFSPNARRLKAPMLLQLSDDEYLSALQSYTVLREVGAPIDMFVFPDEHHVKWQPAHRLAVYRRALDWFDFWLKGSRPTDPARQDEIRHWEELRLDARQAASPDQSPTSPTRR